MALLSCWFCTCFATVEGKFQATAVWNVIVSHLKNTVELKKHRVRLKSYNQCFSGADAVDVVFQYANEQKTNLGTKSVTRQQAAKVKRCIYCIYLIVGLLDCQISSFLDCQISSWAYKSCGNLFLIYETTYLLATFILSSMVLFQFHIIKH